VLAKAHDANVVFCQLAPYDISGEQYNVSQDVSAASFLMNRLLANLGGAGSTPILERFHHGVEKAKTEARWRDGLTWTRLRNGMIPIDSFVGSRWMKCLAAGSRSGCLS